nr:oxidoreductase C-terminal domain-containing protein [Novosphingobium profundi]
MWSDQYGKNIQICGNPELGRTVLTDPGVSHDARCWAFLDDTGRLVGAVAIDAPRAFRPLRRMLQKGHTDFPTEGWI